MIYVMASIIATTMVVSTVNILVGLFSNQIFLRDSISYHHFLPQ